MANNIFQHKRSTVSGVIPTTGDLSAGELGINLADKKLFTANSSAVFELGSNLTSVYVGNTSSALTVNSALITIPATIALSANGSNGTAGQVLTSNSAGIYWSTVSGGGGVAGSNTQVQFNDSGVANASAAFTFDKASNTLTATLISDVAGNLRDVPVTSQSSAYQLASSDAGECVSTSSGGITVNGAVLAAGFTATIFNNSVANTTITAGAGVTMYLAGTSATGNRTLTQRGLATVICVAANTFAITGSGLF